MFAMVVVGLCRPLSAEIDPRLDVARDAPAEIAPLNTPFDMPQLQRPKFADRTFNIRDYGAELGGEKMCTEAIAKAIDACAKAGGGRVLVPEGDWLTGPIHLQSNVNLHLADGAVVRFSQKFEDYLPVVLIQRGGVRCYNYSPLIYARDCENIAVTGEGDATLDGQGKVWWPWKKKQPGMKWLLSDEGGKAPLEERVFGTPEQGVRPPFVQFYSCRNVLLEGFTITNTPSWTLHPVYCENVIVRRLNVLTYGAYNGDGIDPDSCRNMLIEYCYFDSGDDCVVLKAGRNHDAWAVGIPCENIVIRHCAMRHGHGAMTIGSEMSAGVRNVLAHDLIVNGTQRAIYVKTQPGRGGIVENIHVRDVDILGVGGQAIYLNTRYTSGNPDSRLPILRNIHINNVRCEKAKRAIKILGLSEQWIENVSFTDLKIHADKGVETRYVRGLRFDRVKIITDDSPVFTMQDTEVIKPASDLPSN
ncbi:glycoside hydrolase family 28 protein [Planctomycetales bacterium ZRK34]|nr:glycoside hydrolase family 28 protein [Planctomycetales bacterium ZRK34]